VKEEEKREKWSFFVKADNIFAIRCNSYNAFAIGTFMDCVFDGIDAKRDQATTQNTTNQCKTSNQEPCECSVLAFSDGGYLKREQTAEFFAFHMRTKNAKIDQDKRKDKKQYQNQEVVSMKTNLLLTMLTNTTHRNISKFRRRRRRRRKR
jgi:hypothetical protein